MIRPFKKEVETDKHFQCRIFEATRFNIKQKWAFFAFLRVLSTRNNKGVDENIGIIYPVLSAQSMGKDAHPH